MQRVHLVPHRVVVGVVVMMDLAEIPRLHLVEVGTPAMDILLHIHAAAEGGLGNLEDQVVMMDLVVVVVVAVGIDENLAEEAVWEEEAVTLGVTLIPLTRLLLRQAQGTSV